VFILRIYYNGATIPPEYTDPLNTLLPVSVEQSVVPINEMNKYTQADRDGANCAKGLTRAVLPVSADSYDLPALRKVLDIFAAMPLEFRNSVVFLEAYATNKVGEIASNSTAYPDRDGQLLLAPLLNYAKNGSLDAIAWNINTKIRDTLLEGTGKKLEAYINYARGDESVEEVYGYEPWRLEKLRNLKKEYDPYGRFNFFAPIV
jgi:FAD/FMN-containing dehydrogenase